MRQQNGFSLVQLMITAGLVGGLALVLIQLVSYQNQASKKAFVDQEVFEIINRVQTTLLDSEACKKSLTSLGNLSSPTAITTLKDKNDSSINLSTQNVQVISISPKQPVNIVANSGTITLSIALQRKLTYGQLSNINKEVTVSVVTDSGNVITNCYGTLDNAISSAVNNACTSLGGVMSGSQCLINGEILLKTIQDLKTRVATLESAPLATPTPTPTPTSPPSQLYNPGSCSAVCNGTITGFGGCGYGAKSCTITLKGPGVTTNPTSTLSGTCKLNWKSSGYKELPCSASCTASCTANNIPIN